MNFEECLSAVDGFGKYQKVVIYLVLLPSVLPCAFHAYNQVFMSAVPDHWCHLKNGTVFHRSSIPPVVSEADGEIAKYEACRIFDRNDAVSDNSNGTERVCESGWVYDTSKYEATVVTEWDLVCEKDYLPTLALTLFGFGGLVGNFVFGYLQDGLGRRPAFFLYLAIEIIFSIASAFATNFALWTVLRMGVGFTVPAILGTPYVLSVELVGPRKRGYCTILVNVTYSLALIALSVMVYLVRDWKRLTMVTTLPFVVYIFYWWAMPESPRWLVAQGKFDAAEKILKKMARVNGRIWSSDLIIKLKENREAEKENNKSTRRFGVTDLFRYPSLRMKTITMTFIWFANTAVYVGLSYYVPHLGGDEFFNFFLAGLVELPTYIFLLPAMERGGRRWTLCASMVLGGIACMGTVASERVRELTIALYCIGKMGISSSFVVLPLLASETYPTVVRGIGMSFSSVIGQIGPVVIPMINHLGKKWVVLPLLIMGALSVAGGVLSLLLPETLNRHLPQNLEDGEIGFMKNEKIVSERSNSTFEVPREETC